MKKKLNKKMLLMFGLPILALALVSAALVVHFATVETTIEAKEPIVLYDALFELDGETLNDGQNHYLLIKGENKLDVEVPATAVITITKDGLPLENNEGLHLAIDAGGDMHYCYVNGGDMTGITDCDTQYVEYLENNNEAWFDWLGTDATYVDSEFESPIINHGGDSFYNIDVIGGTFVNGVLTLPGIDPDSGLLAALLVIRADPGLEPGIYTIRVDLNPVTA